jgi:hypothetical protein
MTPEEIQTELDKCRKIIFATIDYTIQKEAGKLQPDQIDYSANFHRLWKEQVEKQYQDHHLDKLKKSLETVTLNYKITGDLDFVKYIKEKTGYDFDLFGNIQERIDKIIARGWVANQKETLDIATMIELYRKTGVGQENAHVLHNLSVAFFDAVRKKKNREGDIFPGIKYLCEINSPDNTKYLTMSENGYETGYPSTHINLTIEAGNQISVFVATDVDLDIKTYWKDNHRIMIEIKKDCPVYMKHEKVHVMNDHITVEYIET